MDRRHAIYGGPYSVEAQEIALPALADYMDALDAAEAELLVHLKVARSYEGGDEMCDEIEAQLPVDERAAANLAKGYKYHKRQIFLSDDDGI